MKAKILMILLLYFSSYICVKAQVGIGTPDPKAILDVESTKQGLLIPRITASQIENISVPRLGELVFATTNNGSIINNTGFWYYNGTTWRPFGASLQLNVNIYQGDGTLSSDRTVNMNGNNLSFDTDKLMINSTNQRVGIGESSPQQTLDVNGNIRVRNLSGGNVVALSDGTLAIGPKVPYGTVKESLRSTDHNGWYKLDGRSLTALPAIAQTNAAALGITGSLINSNNRLMKQGAALATGGAASITLVRANLPNYNITGTTATAAGHTHTAVTSGYNVVPAAAGNAFVVRSGRGAAAGTATVTLPSAGAHSHSGTVSSGGSGTALNIMPESISYTYFIYLGQ